MKFFNIFFGKYFLIAKIISIILIYFVVTGFFRAETNSAIEYKNFNFAKKNIVDITNLKDTKNLDKKLVFLSGLTHSSKFLDDENFSISTNAIILERNVEMYQWVEKKRKKKYTYDRVWHSNRVNSEGFFSDTHKNPELKFKSLRIVNNETFIDKYFISPVLLETLSDFKPLDLSNNNNLPNGFYSSDGLVTNVNKTSGSPKLGDLKIQFQEIAMQNVAVVGMLENQGIKPYVTEDGEFFIAKAGNWKLESFVKHHAEKINSEAWKDRMLYSIGILICILFCFKWLTIFDTVLPQNFKNMFEVYSLPIIVLLTLTISSITIATAQILYQPILAICLYILAYFMIKQIERILLKRNKPKSPEKTESSIITKY